MDKILITGGLGFIGSHVAARLAGDGHQVSLMDNLSPQIHGVIPRPPLQVLQNDKIRILRGDVRCRQDWVAALEGIDCVLHFAAETGTAQSMYEIDHYSRTNIGGTALFLDLLANHRHGVKKIVLASSRAVYGEGAYDCASCGRVFPRSRTAAEMRAGQWELRCPKCARPINCVATPEDSQASPASIYAVTKLSQEHLIGIGSALGIATVILRFHNVYGEGQSLRNPYSGILSIFSNRIRLGKTIFLFEDGNESRDFVHVSDVANAVCLATELPGGDGKTLNVGSGIPTSVSRVAQCLIRSLGSSQEPVISHEYRIGDIRHCYADLTRIGQALGFVPAIGLDEGLDRFARWVMTQPVEEDELELANRQLEKRGLIALKESSPR